MNILEADQSPKIKKAAELVQKIYQKEGQHLIWRNDSNPTISSLIDMLHIKFLSKLIDKRDIDLFIEVGQQWVDVDNTDIFDRTSTGTANGEDMMRLPAYFEEKKGRVFEIVDMTPQEYIVATKSGFVDPSFKPTNSLVEEYTYKVLGGSKMPLPYLEYILTIDERRGEYTSFSQEGRHRAYVAKGLGAKTMPVMIVAGVDNPFKMQGKLKPFAQQIFNKFK